MRADYDTALEKCNAALRIYESLHDHQHASIVRGNIGNIYDSLSDYPRALEYFSHALAQNEKDGNKVAAASIRGNIGGVYQYLADYPRALEYYTQALAEHEELGNEAAAAIIRGNIGIAYSELSDYPRAIEYLTRALATNEELGVKASAASVRGNIGGVFYKLCDYPLALEYMTQALAEYEELGTKARAAHVRGNIGIVYADLAEYPLALEYFNRALAEHIELGNRAGAAHIRGNIGKVYANEHYAGFDAAKAEEYLLEALSQAEELGDKRMHYEFCKIIADLYEAMKRWSEVSAYYKRYHELYVEVQSDEAIQQAQQMEYRRKIEESDRDRQVKLARFQEQEKMLHNILPAQIAERILDGETRIADSYKNVSIFFSDIIGFTRISQNISADELVTLLNDLFVEFDRLARKNGLEKIKTIGDAYMAVAGAPIAMEDHAQRVANFAIDVQLMMKDYRSRTQQDVHLRIGLHCGTVVAGVIGENKFSYDLWGDAVNTAARMESHGEAGRIHVSEEFRNELISTSLNELPIQFIPRGEMDIKGKGKMKTYFLER
ncbi:MAG: tetratricopeptide repeat protein [Bacteroidetes bacterium]|nr:tetratricopeptide repeat protein [Bacteroidota bacterium]